MSGKLLILLNFSYKNYDNQNKLRFVLFHCKRIEVKEFSIVSQLRLFFCCLF
jgi:hypothetical protein